MFFFVFFFFQAEDGIRDGTVTGVQTCALRSVPVSVLLRRGTPLDGSRPLLLYAYGSYGATIEPTFNSNVLSLVDRGFIYAIAHIRGGQEMGRRWYDDGKMMHKLNTFRDYLDVGEELVRLKY